MSTRAAPLRLLLATEHTEQDAGAEAVALALARRRDEPLAVVLPLARDAELEMTAPAAAERADAEAATRRESLAARAEVQGVKLDLRLRRGPEPHAEILDEARGRGTGLLVIRRRGRRGLLANLLVGEMVGKVLMHAPCSVLVVPREGRLWQRAVLVAVDPQRREASLPAAAAGLASECGAALHLVCVVAREDLRPGAEQALAQALRDSGDAAARGEVRIGAVPAEIVAAAQACGADLLVVARHDGGRAPARARLGSVAREVTGLAACPVLVYMPMPTPAAASLPAKGA
jgi:nucleotide-binding universal stress UspA family protein